MEQLKNEYPHDFLFCLEEANLRRDAGEGMRAVEAYRQIQADNAKPGYFADARMELADFGLGDALRGQRHFDEAAQAFEEAAGTPGVGLDLKIRALLNAGECRDVAGSASLRFATTRLLLMPARILRVLIRRGGICGSRTREIERRARGNGECGRGRPHTAGHPNDEDLSLGTPVRTRRYKGTAGGTGGDENPYD